MYQRFPDSPLPTDRYKMDGTSLLTHDSRRFKMTALGLARSALWHCPLQFCSCAIMTTHVIPSLSSTRIFSVSKQHTGRAQCPQNTGDDNPSRQACTCEPTVFWCRAQ